MHKIFIPDSTLFDNNGLLKASKLGPLILVMLISSDWLLVRCIEISRSFWVEQKRAIITDDIFFIGCMFLFVLYLCVC